MTFFKMNFFFKDSFRNIIRVSDNLDPDQDQQIVGPDLGPNCLQRLSADGKSQSIPKVCTYYGENGRPIFLPLFFRHGETSHYLM